MTNKNHHDNPRLRQVGTVNLLEFYWVIGLSTNEIVDQTPYNSQGTVQQALDDRGIPLRDKSDAKKLRDGNVELEDLRQDYLNKFMYVLTSELRAIREDRLLETRGLDTE